MMKLNLFLFAVLACLFVLTRAGYKPPQPRRPSCPKCPPNSHCEIRKDYGYKLVAICVCDRGYTKFGRICKANCQPRCHSYGICTVDHYQPTCTCRPGFLGNGYDCKRDRCYKNDCHENADCVPQLYGDYTCKCKPGFLGIGRKCLRISVPVCYPRYHKQAGCCSPNYQPKCTCKPRYTGNGCQCRRDKCYNHQCHQYATCIPNLYKSGYSCRCNEGYLGDGWRNCYRKCKPRCDENADCKLVDGKSKCICKPGYIGNGLYCYRDLCYNHECHEHATCFPNSYGNGYTCKCNKGFWRDGKKCVPECKPGCDKDADCKVVDGKPKCVCKPGYIGNGHHCIRNKCYQHQCHENAACVPHLYGNGYDCRCNTGYWGNGRTCYSQSSCVARCNQYKYGFPCQCNNACEYYKNCCKDYSYKCSRH